MSNINWKKHADRQRVQRHGAEDKAAPSKDALRREADRLLAGYTGPVTKLPAGSQVIGSRVSGEIPRQPSGNVARSVTVRSDSTATFRSERKVEMTAPKARKSKARRRQTDLFATASNNVPKQNILDRAVPPGLVIYCDGACEPNPGAGGWGFVVYNDCEEVFHASGGSLVATNQTMELAAAIAAIEWIVDYKFKPPIRILSDSQYVVKGCNEWRHSWKRNGWRRGGPNAKDKNSAIANLALWQELDQLLTIVPITLEWCKGHVGIIGNERADELSLIGRAEAMQAGPATAADLIEQQLDYSARIA